MEKNYSPKNFEENISKKWEEKKIFSLDNQPEQKAWTHINIMPPPNANWILHLWHASWETIMDIAWRYARMNWKKTFLLPWKDHAWIMTQVIYEKYLAENWIDKEKMSRQELFDWCYKFCEENADWMRSQEKRVWVCADWEKEIFTLEPKVSEHTVDTFVKMYEDWIAYKWNRIINWCPHCQTAVSDIEVEHKDSEWKIRDLKYPIKWTDEFITVATTRPETMLWDTWIAVNPEDERYKDLIWKTVIVPIVNREIKIVTNPEIDLNFWTWAVKITPAHDPLDWKIWQENNLKEITVIWKDWKIVKNEEFLEFEWLSIKEASKLVVKKFEEIWLLWEIKKHLKPLSLHDRCWNAVEPLTSPQWWIDTDNEKFSLKKEAIKAVKEWKIEIIPKHFEKTFYHWMENLQPRCISRQLWWWHQIPAFYKNKWQKDEEIKIQTTSPWPEWTQESDTFDTWFSSWQWATNTVKSIWHEEFIPSDFMVMWRDILFFWAARMIMMSLYLSDWEKVPFKKLYLTWLILDKNWKKMSKSKWNWIDPLEMSDKYWTDALRLALFIWNAPWTDMRLWEEKIEWFRNFVNKLWNATRFVKMQVEWDQENNPHPNPLPEWEGIDVENLNEVDKWILTSLESLIKDVTRDIENYQYSNAWQKLYDFAWNQFCDWYLELSKWENKNLEVLAFVMKNILKLLHPFVPFITEVLNEELFWDKKMLTEDKWPEFNENLIFEESLKNIENIIWTIKSSRELRRELKIDPVKKINLKIKTSRKEISDSAEDIKRIARLENLEIWENLEKWEWDFSDILNSEIEIILPLEWNVDKEKEAEKKAKEIEECEKQIANLKWRLANESYVKNAPAKLIEDSRNKLEEFEKKLEQLRKS